MAVEIPEITQDRCYRISAKSDGPEQVVNMKPGW
jgi:hypothetical protein